MPRRTHVLLTLGNVIDFGHRLAQPPSPPADLGEITVQSFDRLAETISRLPGVSNETTWGEVEQAIVTQDAITRAIQNALLEPPPRTPGGNALVRQIGAAGPGLAQPRSQAGGPVLSGPDAQRPSPAPRSAAPGQPLLGQGAITERMADFEQMANSPWAWLDKGIKDAARGMENFRIPRPPQRAKAEEEEDLGSLFGNNLQSSRAGGDGLFGNFPPALQTASGAQPLSPQGPPASAASAISVPPPAFQAYAPDAAPLALGSGLLGGLAPLENGVSATGMPTLEVPAAGSVLGGPLSPAATETRTTGLDGAAGMLGESPAMAAGLASPLSPTATETRTAGLAGAASMLGESPAMAPGPGGPPGAPNPVLGGLLGGQGESGGALSADRDLSTEFKEQGLKTDTAMFGLLNDPRNTDFGRFLQSDVLGAGGPGSDPAVGRGLFTLLGILTGIGAIMNALGINPEELVQNVRDVVTGIVDFFKTVWNIFRPVIGNVVALGTAAWEQIRGAIQEPLTWQLMGAGAILGGLLGLTGGIGGVALGSLVGAGLGLALGTGIHWMQNSAVDFGADATQWNLKLRTLLNGAMTPALIGAGLGGVLGAVVGGPKGALIGALAGAGIGLTLHFRSATRSFNYAFEAQQADHAALMQAAGAIQRADGTWAGGNAEAVAHAMHLRDSGALFNARMGTSAMVRGADGRLQEVARGDDFNAQFIRAGTDSVTGLNYYRGVDQVEIDAAAAAGLGNAHVLMSVGGEPRMVRMPAFFGTHDRVLDVNGQRVVFNLAPRRLGLQGGATYELFIPAGHTLESIAAAGWLNIPMDGPVSMSPALLAQGGVVQTAGLIGQGRHWAGFPNRREARNDNPLLGMGPVSGNIRQVNDAIITKTGQVIHTHPEDSIYAFKGSVKINPVTEHHEHVQAASPFEADGGNAASFGNPAYAPPAAPAAANSVTQNNYATNLPFSDFMVVGV